MHGYILSTSGRFRLYLQLVTRGTIKSPRSAPACSMAARMSLSISFSRTISPETACETLITVARSRCSTGAAIMLLELVTGLLLPELRILLIELAHFAFGSPAEIAVPGFSQIRIRYLVETSRRIESCGKFVGERLVVDEARLHVPSGLPVRKAASASIVAAFDARDLGRHECCAVFEILRDNSPPIAELLLVFGQSRRNARCLFIWRCTIASGRSREALRSKWYSACSKKAAIV